MIDRIYEGSRLFLENHDYLLNNVYIFEWESDLFGVSKSKYAVEVEVKISRSDFLADFKKKKHQMFKEARQAGKGQSFTNIPNRFYFACPHGMIFKDEIPAYAGLIYCNTSYCNFEVIKPAPLLHTTKINFDKVLLSKYYHLTLNTRSRIYQMLHQMKRNPFCEADIEKDIRSILRGLK